MTDTAGTPGQRDRRSTRRGFLACAGTGAAGAIVLGAARMPSAGATPTRAPANATEPLVAYVRDAHSGEITVMVGEREVTVRDHDLAARIARAGL